MRYAACGSAAVHAKHAVCVLEVDEELCLLALRFVEGADQCVDESAKKLAEEAALVVLPPHVDEADDVEENQLRSCQ